MNTKLLAKICNYLHDTCYHREDLEYFYDAIQYEILDSKLPKSQIEIFTYNTLDNLKHVIRNELIKF